MLAASPTDCAHAPDARASRAPRYTNPFTPYSIPEKSNTTKWLLSPLAPTGIAVALVTVHAVVDVTADSLMSRIGVRLRVAVRALKDAVVAWIGMAGGTNAIGVTVIGIEPGVIEGRTCPTSRRMADRASRWEARGNMVRIVGSLIFRLVTAITICGKGRVIVVHV